MVRKGTLAFLVFGLAACTQDVDDPANFTAGNSMSNTAASSSSGTGGGETDGATSVAEGSASATSTTGPGPADSSGSASASASATTAGTGMSGNCGNGVIDAGEQCDGDDLQGFDCASLGLNGGILACDPMMCTFDTSMCMAGGGTSG